MYIPAGLMVEIPEEEKRKMMDRLKEPFDPRAIKQRKMGSKMASYLEGTSVINRLNEVCWKYGWDNQLISKEVMDMDIGGKTVKVILALVRLKIYGIGEHDAWGIQELQGGGADMVKGAMTDGLKKAASWFGVGIQLYGPDFEDEKYEMEEKLQLKRDFDKLTERIFGPIGNPKYLFSYWLKNFCGVEQLKGLDLILLRSIKARLESNEDAIIAMMQKVASETPAPTQAPPSAPAQSPATPPQAPTRTQQQAQRPNPEPPPAPDNAPPPRTNQQRAPGRAVNPNPPPPQEGDDLDDPFADH